jgi:hypothetical protein
LNLQSGQGPGSGIIVRHRVLKHPQKMDGSSQNMGGQAGKTLVVAPPVLFPFIVGKAIQNGHKRFVRRLIVQRINHK